MTFLRKRSVAFELRLRAQVEARKEAEKRLMAITLRVTVGMLALLSILSLTLIGASASGPTIKEVHATQLQKIVETRDFVAVFWYARNCRTCERALAELEHIDDDAEKHSVDFVKINDKRLAKTFGVKKFPALTFFQDGDITIYKGDMTNNAQVLEFLTSDAMLVIPNKIEETSSYRSVIRTKRSLTQLAPNERKENKRSLTLLIKFIWPFFRFA